MAGRQLFSREPESGADKPDDAGSSAARGEVVKRLQVGLGGLGAVLLVAAGASVLMSRAQIAEDRAVPDAAPTTEPTEAAPQSDPLADAGAAPPVPVDPEDKKDATAPDEPGPQGVATETPTIPDIEPN
jgi:hypothetical protein